METTNNKNLATFTHLSTLSQYCIPFGNFVFPLLIWSTNKDKSEFIDYHGKQALNFQLSIFLYTLVLAMIAFPVIFITIFSNIPYETAITGDDFLNNNLSFQNITGIVIVAILAVVLFIILKVAEFVLIMYASVKTSNGDKYVYPLTISFFK